MYLQLKVTILCTIYRQNPNQSSSHSYDIYNFFPYFKNSIQCINQNVIKFFFLSVNKRIRRFLVIRGSQVVSVPSSEECHLHCFEIWLVLSWLMKNLNELKDSKEQHLKMGFHRCTCFIAFLLTSLFVLLCVYLDVYIYG